MTQAERGQIAQLEARVARARRTLEAEIMREGRRARLDGAVVEQLDELYATPRRAPPGRLGWRVATCALAGVALMLVSPWVCVVLPLLVLPVSLTALVPGRRLRLVLTAAGLALAATVFAGTAWVMWPTCYCCC